MLEEDSITVDVLFEKEGNADLDATTASFMNGSS
jgi:hypothetical protein